MTDTTPAAIEALMTCITDGRAVQFHPNYCPEAKDAPVIDWDTSHHISVIREDGSRYRIAEFRHSAEAAFHCVARDLVPALAAERDAAIRDRDQALLREAALLANNEAERKTFVAHNARHAAEASALRDEVARLRSGIAVLAAHPEDEGCHMCGDFSDFYRDQCNYAARLLTALTSKGGEG